MSSLWSIPLSLNSDKNNIILYVKYRHNRGRFPETIHLFYGKKPIKKGIYHIFAYVN